MFKGSWRLQADPTQQSRSDLPWNLGAVDLPYAATAQQLLEMIRGSFGPGQKYTGKAGKLSRANGFFPSIWLRPLENQQGKINNTLKQMESFRCNKENMYGDMGCPGQDHQPRSADVQALTGKQLISLSFQARCRCCSDQRNQPLALERAQPAVYP